MSLLFRFSYRRNRTLTLENGLIASLSASCTSESRTLSKRAPGQLHASSNFCTTAVNVNSKVVIYGFPLSQPTRSVLMLCEEENIPYEVIIVDALKGENRKPAFKRMHPAGLVPVINDNGMVLGESASILVYLCESRRAGKFYPLGSDLASIAQRAHINFWLHWNHGNTRAGTKNVLVPHLFPPRGTVASNEQVVTPGIKEFARSLDMLEAHLVRTQKPFLCGDHVTLADLAVITELDQLGPAGFALFNFASSSPVSSSGFPSVDAWMKSLAQSLASYAKVFEPVAAMAKSHKAKQQT